MTEFLTIPELARELNLSRNTIYHWRYTGYGPKAAKIGRRVLYRRSDIQEWLDAAFSDANHSRKLA